MAKKVGKTQRIHTVSLINLTGGMNVSRSPEFLEDDECVRIENFEFDIEGDKLRTRRGLGSPLFTFNSPITYIYNDYSLNVFYIFLKDKKIYKYEFGKTPTFIGILNGNSDRPSCCKFGGNLLIASGSKLQKYNYQNLTEITQSPNADIVFSRFGRVVVSKAGQDLLIYSAIGNDEDWHENSNDDSARKDVNVGYKDDGDIQAVAQLATDLIVFKNNGLIYNVQNEPSDWNITPIGDNSDFISMHACLNLNNDTTYVSTHGLRSVATSQSYANFQKKDIGEKCNPAIKQRVDKPYLSELRRTKQLLINGYCGNEVWCYHYALNAFTKWVFPWPVTSICENRYHTLVSMNKGDKGGLYELSWNNETDDGLKIPQYIESKELRDTHDMNVYRTYVDIEAKHSGSGIVRINDVEIPHSWTSDEQQREIKSQIRSPRLRFYFETDDVIIFKFISFDIVMEKEAMVTQGNSSGRRSGGFASSTRKSKHDDFLKGMNSSGGTPYG